MAQRSCMPRWHLHQAATHLLKCYAAQQALTWAAPEIGAWSNTSTNAQELARRLPEPEERESKSQEDLLHEVQPSQSLSPGWL